MEGRDKGDRYRSCGEGERSGAGCGEQSEQGEWMSGRGKKRRRWGEKNKERKQGREKGERINKHGWIRSGRGSEEVKRNAPVIRSSSIA